MGYGNHCKSSPRYCVSTQDSNEWMNNHYHNTNDDDDEKIFPKFALL